MLSASRVSLAVVLLVMAGSVWSPVFAQDGDDSDEVMADGGVADGSLFIGQALDPDDVEDEDDQEYAQVDLRLGKADDGRRIGDDERVPGPADEYTVDDELRGGAAMGCSTHPGDPQWAWVALLLACTLGRRRLSA